MSESRERTRAAVRHLATQSLRETPHPTDEALFAYHQRELRGPEHDRVQAHVAVCSTCARTLLDLAAFPEVEHRTLSAIPSKFEVRQALRETVEALHRAPGADRRPVNRMLAAAAGLFLMVGSTGWLHLLLPEEKLPVRNIELQVVRGGNERGSDLLLRFEPSTEQLYLTFEDAAKGFPKLEIVILDPDERVVRRISDLYPSELQDISVGLPQGYLEPGEYRLEIYGLRDGSSRELDSFPLFIE